MDKDKVVKNKFLFGLFYLKQNIEDRTFSFRFLGINIFSCKLKNSLKKYYLLFIPVWIKCANREFCKVFLDKTISEYPNYDDYYIFLSISGEFFLLMHHFREWLNKNNSKNFLCVFSAKYHMNIFKMFFPDYPVVYIKMKTSLVSRAIKDLHFKYKNKNIYIPFYEKYFRKVEDNIRNNKNAHYYIELKQHLGLDNCNMDNYIISEKTKEKVQKIAKYVLNDNFVIISPESGSNETLNKSFWEELTNKLISDGYEVFCSVTHTDNLIKNTQMVFLSFEESIELTKYSKAIIGLRSGFLECLSQTNVPLFAFYTDFPNRNGFKRIKSKDVLKGFSIKKLPNVNSEKIFEYDINRYNSEEEISNDILSKIKSLKGINVR